MPIDRNTAAQLITNACDRVWRKWHAHIPAAYRVPPHGFFVLHDSEASLRIPFTPVWDGRFKAANLSNESAATVTLPGGFVSPERSPLLRRIHINLSGAEFDWEGFIAHEYIHWLSHENFYPRYYSSNPPWTVDVVEGATDYLMLKCFTGYADGLILASQIQYRNHCRNIGVGKLPKSARAVYNWKKQYDNVKAWVKSSPGNETALANFVFNGVYAAIT